MKSVQQIVAVLKEKGYKITPQRLAIFEALEGNTSHPSAEQLFIALRKKHPTISFTTVYNTLQTLKDLGEIRELAIDPERRRYDPDLSSHHHAICSECGAIFDVYANFSHGLTLPEELKNSFIVKDFEINFYGRCTNCSSSETSHEV